MNLFFHIVASIIRLFLSCSPSAILRAIITIIIDSIYAFPCWPLAHVRKKNAEIILPLFANAYITTPITGITRCIRVGTSLDHAIPYFIFNALLHAMLGNGFNLCAATGDCTTGNQSIVSDNSSFSTRTFTYPISPISMARGFFFNQQPIKFQSGNIFRVFSKHNVNYNTLIFSGQGGING